MARNGSPPATTYLWTAPGEGHDGFAEEESVFFVVLPGGLDLGAAAPVAPLP